MGTGQEQRKSAKTVAYISEKHSGVFERLWDRWQSADDKLAELARQEDSRLKAGTTQMEDIDADIDDLLLHQHQIIEDLAALRSTGLNGVCIKLNVWRAQVFSGNTEINRSCPHNTLILQAIYELNEIRRSAAN